MAVLKHAYDYLTGRQIKDGPTALYDQPSGIPDDRCTTDDVLSVRSMNLQTIREMDALNIFGYMKHRVGRVGADCLKDILHVVDNLIYQHLQVQGKDHCNQIMQLEREIENLQLDVDCLSQANADLTEKVAGLEHIERSLENSKFYFSIDDLHKEK